MIRFVGLAIVSGLIAGGTVRVEAQEALDPISASSDVHLVMDLRPPAILEVPEFQKLAGQIPAEGMPAIKAIASGAIEQILILGFEPRQGEARASGLPPFTMVVFRSNRPLDWKMFVSNPVEEVDQGGVAYLRPRMGGTTCYRVLDERTLLVGPVENILAPSIAGNRPRGRHGWDDAWSQLKPGPIRVAFDMPWLVHRIQPMNRMDRFWPIRVVAPLYEKTQAVGLTMNIAEGLTLDALASSATEDDAAQVAATLKALKVLAGNIVPDLHLMAERAPQPNAAAQPMVDLVDSLAALLNSAKVEQDGSVAFLHAQTDNNAIAFATAMILPAVQASREADLRLRSINNLKQIGLAMHNYESTFGNFPPAVLMGPDGKTPHSWRVALLPYLEQNTLYNDYKFDEPWDGPNNRKLIDRMPAVFHDPANTDAAPGSPSYFVLNGPDTLFPDHANGVSLAEIIDGTSNTVMVVESRRDIPWTKPEDIPYDRDKPLPTLGGLHPGGFNALMGDGSVHFLKSSINNTLFRALFSRNGGEVISSDSF